ncbi:MAG: Yip1 family protein [bacterium]
MSDFEDRPAASPDAGEPFMERLVYIFTEPERVFRAVRRRPAWLPAFFLVLLFAVLSIQATYPLVAETQREAILSRSDLTAEEAQRAVESIEMFEGPAGRLIMTLTVVISTTVSFLVIAGALLFGGNFLLGGETGFKTVMGLTAYAWIPYSIGKAVVQVPLVLAKGSLAVSTSLNVLLPPDRWSSPLGIVLGSVDIFAIWMIVLVTIGMSTVYGFSRRRSAGLVVGLYAASVLLFAGLSALTSGIMS